MKFLRDMFGLNSDPTPAQLGKKLLRELQQQGGGHGGGGLTDVPKCLDLINRGADLNGLGYGKSIVAFALDHDIKLLNLLIDKGAPLDIPNSYIGNTPLHEAVSTGRTEHAEALIKAGANFDTMNKKAQTAYELAQKNAHSYALVQLMDQTRQEKAAAAIPDAPTTPAISEAAPVPDMKKNPFPATSAGATRP